MHNRGQHRAPGLLLSARTLRAIAFAAGAGCLQACGGGGGDGETASVPSRRMMDAGTPDWADASQGTGPRTPVSCRVAEDDIHRVMTAAAAVSVGPMAVQEREGGFGMAFVEPGMGCVDSLRLAQLGGNRPPDTLHVETISDDCSKVDASAVATAGDEYLVAAVDNRGGTTELWVQRWTETDGGKAHAVTDSDGRESDVAIASYDEDAAMVAWVARDRQGGLETLRVRPLDANGKPTGSAVTVSEGARWFYSTLSLSRMGDQMALAYHRFDVDGSSQVVLELLDADTAEVTQDRQVMADDAGPEPTAALAADATGGALLFSRTTGVNARQLWLQRLGPDGKPAANSIGSLTGGDVAPLRLVNSPERAIDGSLAKLASGYVLGYRQLTGDDRADIKMMFLEGFGRKIGDAVVAEGRATSGSTSVGFSLEGRMAFAWSDVDEDNVTHLYMARVPCVDSTSR